MSGRAGNYDSGLIKRLRVDLKDYERGVSGASKCENVRISKKQYIRMAELAIIGLEGISQTSELKSYFLIDVQGEDGGHACGPFGTMEEAQQILELVSTVKRLGYLAITECERVIELEALDQ